MDEAKKTVLSIAVALVVGVAALVGGAGEAHAQRHKPGEAPRVSATSASVSETDGGRGGDFLFQLHLGGGVSYLSVSDSSAFPIAPVGTASAFFGVSFDAPSGRTGTDAYFGLGYQGGVAMDESGLIGRHQLALTMRVGNLVQTFAAGVSHLATFQGSRSLVGGSFGGTMTVYFGTSCIGLSIPVQVDILAGSSKTVALVEVGLALTVGNF